MSDERDRLLKRVRDDEQLRRLFEDGRLYRRERMCDGLALPLIVDNRVPSGYVRVHSRNGVLRRIFKSAIEA